MKLESYLASCPMGIAFLDRDLRYQHINAALAKLHGKPVADHMGRTVRDVSPKLAPVVEPMLDKALADGPSVTDLEIEGSYFLASYFPVRDQETVVGVGVVMVDITGRRLVEDDVRALATSREQVLSVVSHDLRSPLSTIQLTARLLASQVVDDPRARQHLDVIQRAAMRMQRLIEDLNESTAIRAGRLSLKTARESVRDIVAESLLGNQVLAAERDVHLIADESGLDEIQLDCDRWRILQVLGNLVANALKASPQGDTITLIARSTPVAVIFGIRDTGRGIPREQLASLFDHDHAVEHRAGLGLYICKGIVEAHGGRIWVDSAVGEGTTVWFALPRTAET